MTGAPKKLLTKKEILEAKDVLTEDIQVPQWGGIIRIKTMSGAEGDQFEASVMIKNGTKFEVNPRRLRVKLVAMCVIGEDGKRLFSDDDIAALDKKSRPALDFVFKECQELNGIGDDEIKNLEEGLEEGQEDGSPSA